MQQVPTYLIIGNGRLARHLSFYFQSQNITFKTWSRSQGGDLGALVHSVETVLLCISDSALESFVNDNDCLKEKTLVHFSGATFVKDVLAFHPLMTFSHDPYDKDFYPTIPFISFNSDVSFKSIFPMLKNPTSVLDEKLMPYYHSLCVMGGNFTTLLWAKCSEAFREIGINSEFIKPYMQKVFENTLADPVKNLTGPLVRGDQATINKNMDALANPKDKKLYQSFVDISQDMEF